MDEKYCPLNCRTDHHNYCNREKCAWWDELAERCAVKTVALILERKLK